MFRLVVRQRGLVEQDARWYFQQLIIAIDYCHKMVSHDLHMIRCPKAVLPCSSEKGQSSMQAELKHKQTSVLLFHLAQLCIPAYTLNIK